MAKNFSRKVYVLHLSDEMWHPYEAALNPLGVRLEWFTNYSDLLDINNKIDPSVLIIDLDCLATPIEVQLEEVRAAFPASDLIALSSTDSASLALQAIRSGFSDFLLKPASPEELAWNVRKALQRFQFFEKLDDKRANMVKAVSQISTCPTETLVHLCTLEYLKSLLQADAAIWVKLDKEDRKEKPALKVLTHVPRQETQAKLKHPADRIKQWISRETPIWLRSKTSGRRSLILPLSQNSNEAVILYGIDRKISKTTMAEIRALVEHSQLSLQNIRKFEEIKAQTFLDDLTGLYNSRYLRFALNNAMLKCKQPGQAFGLLFIDVDHFKTVNDRYGHLIGSEFLVAIGKTIKNAVRNIDPVFRYGGDEFVVILQGAHQEGASEIGERIRKNIERRVFLIRNQRIQTTVSIGIAVFPDHTADRDTLLRLADEAMYSAKKHTRNAVHLAYGLETPPKTRQISR